MSAHDDFPDLRMFDAPVQRPGNGARETVIDWFEKREFTSIVTAENSADALLGHLWLDGFKIIPLDGSESR